jgi:dipeptidyl aminopeptidase/acylaminoacyl peptidase
VALGCALYGIGGLFYGIVLTCIGVSAAGAGHTDMWLKASVFLSCIVFLSGCVPDVTWLPDSSGFVYTRGKDHQQLVLYDVVKNKSQVLVENTQAPTIWPAVSPDGQQIALARVTREKDKLQSALQIMLYDRSGKLTKRSKLLPWQKQPEQNNERPWSVEIPDKLGGDYSQVFWSPGGDKILLSTQMHMGVYDIKEDRLTYQKDALLYTFGATPIRPDGTGFVVVPIGVAVSRRRVISFCL